MKNKHAIVKLSILIALLATVIPIRALPVYSEQNPDSPTAYANDLLVNGTFEAANDTAWTGSPEGEASKVESPLDPGNSVMKIEARDIPIQWGISEVHQALEVVPLAPYTLSSDVFFASNQLDNSLATTLVSMRIDFYDESLLPDFSNAKSAFISYDVKDIYHPNETFETLRIQGEVPERAKFAKVELAVKAYGAHTGGIAYFDNASMKYRWEPHNLKASARTADSITLTWDKPLYGDGYTYEIRELAQGIVGTTGTTSYTIENLSPPVTDYSFQIVARLTENNAASDPTPALRAATSKPAGTYTIMPIGDSLTVGVKTNPYYIPGGYRAFLQDRLSVTSATYGVHFHFVGSRENNPATDRADFDPDHEGYSGYNTGQLEPIVYREIDMYEPDFVLLYAGTNDMWHDENNRGAVNIRRILEKATADHPATRFIVGTLAGNYSEPDRFLPLIEAFNRDLKQVIADLQALGKKVHLVDIAAAMNVCLDQPDQQCPEGVVPTYFIQGDANGDGKDDGDGYHPVAEGYAAMADVWFNAMDSLIRSGSLEPAAPMGLAAKLNDDNTVDLAWVPGNGLPVDHYEIYLNGDLLEGHVTESGYKVQGLMPVTNYVFMVRAVNALGKYSDFSDTFQVTTHELKDTEPPTPPTNLTFAGPAGPNEALLTWNPGHDNVGINGYEVVYNDVSTVAQAVYGEDGLVSFTLGDLVPETEYTVKVRTIDAAQLTSPYTEPVTVILRGILPPVNVRVTDAGPDGAKLIWSTEQKHISDYAIYRNGELVGQTTEKFMILPDFNWNRSDTFTVASRVNGKESAPSAAAAYHPSLAVKNLKAGNITVTAARLSWDPISGATGYKVIDSLNGERTVTETSFEAKNLTPGTLYRYSVVTLMENGIEAGMAAVEFRTASIPPTPPGGMGGGPVMIQITQYKFEYVSTDKGTTLRFVPGAEKAIEALNGATVRLSLDIPTDKPYDTLELELPGNVLNRAKELKKPISLVQGNMHLEIPPGWLTARDSDTLLLSVGRRPLDKDRDMSGQSLMPLTHAYDLDARINGTPVTKFSLPATLRFDIKGASGADRAGLYVRDDQSGRWMKQTGAQSADHKIGAAIEHFSTYAVMATWRTFKDIAGVWSQKEIEWLANKDIVFGLTDQRFNPSGQVTRAEFTAMLTRAFKPEAVQGDLPFSDVDKEAWYYQDLLAAFKAGWVSGLTPDRFDPNARITREQMTVMMVKAYLSKAGERLKPESGDGLPFKDRMELSEWALPYVQYAVEHSLVYGMNGSFNPLLFADRAQAAVILYRLLQ